MNVSKGQSSVGQIVKSCCCRLSQKMPKYLKSLPYKTVVRTVALYGAEFLSITKTAEQHFDVGEMRFGFLSLYLL